MGLDEASSSLLLSMGSQSSDVFKTDTWNGSHNQRLLTEQGTIDFFSFRKNFGLPETVAVGTVDGTNETKVSRCASRKGQVERHDFVMSDPVRKQ